MDRLTFQGFRELHLRRPCLASTGDFHTHSSHLPDIPKTPIVGIMCRWSSTVFTTCRHAESYLVEFCNHAQSWEEAPAPGTSRLRRQPSLPYRLESIEEEDEPEEMPAGLAPFAAGLRQWRASASGDSTPSSTSTVTPTRYAARHREEGLRGTDESGTLLNDDSIVQHIASSMRGFDTGLAIDDGTPVSEYGIFDDSSEDDEPRGYDELEAIAAEIDTLKEEVQHMRGGSRDRATGKGKVNQASHTASRLPQPVTKTLPPLLSDEFPRLAIPGETSTVWVVSPQHGSDKENAAESSESPAQQMQRRDLQRVRREVGGNPEPIRLPSPPKPHEFPELTPKWALSAARVVAGSGSSQPSIKKQSYARAAGKPVKDAAVKKNSPKQVIGIGSCSVESAGSPSSAASPGNIVEATHLTNKPSPRFAQATKATLRRVDETLRKDNSPAKPSPETSPTKSSTAKGPSLETQKRAAQSNQKRTSLPQGWMAATDHAGSPAEKGDSAMVDQTVSKQAKPTSPLHSKVSSYMSPTKATQRRSIAAIGQNNPKRASQSPRAKGACLTIDTTLQVGKFAIGSSSSSDDTIVGSDDVFFTAPNSRQNSKSPSKQTIKSPLKHRLHSPRQILSPVVGQFAAILSHAALPTPLCHVSNTVGTQPTTGSATLEPIVRRLLEQNLFKARDGNQQGTTSGGQHAGQADALQPLIAKLEKGKAAGGHPNRIIDEAIQRARQGPSTALSSMQPSVQAPLPLVLPQQQQAGRNADVENKPISDLFSGLRGRSSVDIGKALLTPEAEPQESRKRAVAEHVIPADPAILYQGHKPVDGIVPPQQDSAIIFSGSMKDAKPAAALEERNTAQPRSLRATALEFKPSWEIERTKQMAEVVSVAFTGTRIPSNEWKHLSIDVKKEIVAKRERHSDDTGDQSFVEKLRNLSRSGKSERADSAMLSYDDVFDCRTQMLADSAASPLGSSTRTPFISPHSTDTSPPKSWDAGKSSLDRWKIRAEGFRNRPYTWTGSDGLEIRYTGYGPDAERDPNTPVSYSNFRNRTHTVHHQAGSFQSFPRDNEFGSPAPPDAPRRMREWAKHKNYPSVPCPNIDYYGMYESLPWPTSDFGLCHSCREGRNEFARVGGGIDVPVQY